MIQQPARSITRFFIPLLDIMMLLFSMFLLMPMVQSVGKNEKSPEAMSAAELMAQNEKLKTDLAAAKNQVKNLDQKNAELRKYADLQKSLEKLKKEIEELQQAKVDVLQKRLFLQVVAFDPSRDDLIYYERLPQPKTKIIANFKDAGQLIDQHQQQAKTSGLELFYILLLPPAPQGPTQGQLLEYQKWFSNVPYQVLITPQ